MTGGSALSRWHASLATWLTHRPPRLLIGTIALLALAAGIVVHLERLAASEQERHLRASLQQVCEWTATFAAQRVRNFLGGAVHDTIEGVGHPTYKRYDMERITANFAAGIARYPYVDGFLLWSERFGGELARQVIFYRSPDADDSGFRPVSGAGIPDAAYLTHHALGPRLFAEAMANLPRRLNWVVTDVDVGGRSYQTALHLLWDDSTHDSVFAIVGLVVDLTRVQSGVFQALFESDRFDFLRRTAPNLAITVRDERGRMIHGTAVDDEPSLSHASASVSALFFPREVMEHRTHIASESQAWTVVTHATPPPVPPPALRRGLSVSLLMLLVIALYCAVIVERQAMRLSRMQADFIANASHQLKTPLALLSGAAETLVLRRLSTPEKLSEYVEIIRGATDRLTALVHDILDVSRVEARPPRRQPVDVGALVARTVQEFGRGLPRDVILRAEIPSRPAVVAAEPRAIEQVVLNLLDNAVKYGRQGNVVTVLVERLGSEVVVRVRDTGIGIDAADLPHIFEKFYRGRACGADRPGFGLGLGIVDSIVRGHGGRVTVTSKLGTGSEFLVALRASAL